jgi:hypothetical protein
LVVYAISHRILLNTMKNKASGAALRGPRRCGCGKCAGCVDNDRWERIFQQKYRQQERDYYAAGREPRSSGVSAKAFVDASIYACAEEGEIRTSAAADTSVELFYNLLRKASYTDAAA